MLTSINWRGNFMVFILIDSLYNFTK